MDSICWVLAFFDWEDDGDWVLGHWDGGWLSGSGVREVFWFLFVHFWLSLMAVKFAVGI